MLIRIDPTDRTPIFAQIASSVRRSIADGEVHPGERLPAARELAASLDVNMHTVLRGYQILRDDGLVELRRGRGAVVSAHAPVRAEMGDALDRLVEVARRFGVSAPELAAEITRRMT
ncbi:MULTISPECIES: GntR family transcriptional regulator [Gordonia]|uniref:GntR family transcriptional regulator n=1 Tax=Gordonia oleivorans TaxID=3156618 RepID=UPI0032B362A2